MPKLGFKHTVKSRKKMSIAMKGDKNPMFGRRGKENPMYGRTGMSCPNWKGGKSIDKLGYIKIRMPNHPLAHSSPGYVYEHVLVMEKKIGRPLKFRETCHHIDGNPGNNSPENLMLFPNNAKHQKFHGLKRMLLGIPLERKENGQFY